MNMDWFDRAEQELGEQLDNGEITQKEYWRELSDLRAEMQGGAEDAAEQAYNDYMG